MDSLRMRRLLHVLLAATVPAANGRVLAQDTAARVLRPMTVSAVRFGSVGQVRELGDRRVIVNDPARHQVVLLDSTLGKAVVLIDSAAAAGSATRAYGGGRATITPYLADSTWFIDRTAMAQVLLDPNGAIARVSAAPHPADMSSASGAHDPKGRSVYQVPARRAIPPPGASAQEASQIPMPESAFVVRTTPGSQAAETLATVRTARTYPPVLVTNPDGKLTQHEIINPMQLQDSWVLMSGGTVAILREHDFHVDFIDPDGGRRASQPVPYRWERWSDSAKAGLTAAFQAFLDSTINRGPGPGGSRPGTVTLGVPPADDLPDYAQPFIPRQTWADADDQLWFSPFVAPPSPSIKNMLVQSMGNTLPDTTTTYVIMNHAGVVVDRVVVLSGFTIVGFGRGVVYLTSREADGVALVRARVR